MEVMYQLSLLTGEIIGIAAGLGSLAFVILYSRNSNWRQNRPARAIMHVMRGFTLTVALLVFFSFVDVPHEYRWSAEFIVYTPMAVAVWNMFFSLLATVQDKPAFLFIIPRKRKKSEDS